MLTWGDGVSTVDLDALLAFHRSHGKLATLTAVRPPAASAISSSTATGSSSSRRSRRPAKDGSTAHSSFSSPGSSTTSKATSTRFEREPLERLAAEGQLMAYRHYGFWQCMDTLREKMLLDELWATARLPGRSGPIRGRRRMRVLVTGHDGYIGTVLVPMLQEAGHEVVGLDNYLFEDCTFGDEVADVPALRMDVRDVTAADLEGFDAVLHLAAISNDPSATSIPTRPTRSTTAPRPPRRGGEAGRSDAVRLLVVVQPLRQGRGRLPGRGGGLQSGHAVRRVEGAGRAGHAELADDDFSPTYLRNATAYGVSPRLRGDLVVNNLVGYAVTTGEVLIKSDGTPWRPLVHIEDISRAFLAVLHAPREVVHDQAFNVGRPRRTTESARWRRSSRRSCRAAVFSTPRAPARICAATA